MSQIKISIGVIKAALDHSLNGICIVQPGATPGEEPRIVYVNQAFCDMSKFKTKELLGKVPPFLSDSVRFDLGDGEHPYVGEGVLHCKFSPTGEGCPVSLKLSHFTHQDREYIMGSFQDRSEIVRERAVQQTLKSEHNARLGTLLSHIPDVVWECDAHLRFISVSANVQKILGYSAEDLIGEPLYGHMPDEFQAFFREAFPEGEPLLALERIRFPFEKPNGKEVTLELSANPLRDSDGQTYGMIGITRDVTTDLQLEEGSKDLASGMMIKVNAQCQLISAAPEIQRFLGFDPSTMDPHPDFIQFLVDGSVEPLFSFAFMQQEDVPFPVEVRIADETGQSHDFTVDLKYNTEEDIMEGELAPAGANEQLAVMNQKMEQQKESMEMAIDPEMRQTVLDDSQNLAGEILALIKALESFGYPQEDALDLQEFGEFIQDKNIHEYRENLRLLGNKVHGLKGTSGFLISASKQLCHRVEEITRPLAEQKLVLTVSIARLLKQFIFKVQEMLEQFQKDPESVFDIEDWLIRIDEALERGLAYLGDQTGDLVTLIVQRSTQTEGSQQRKAEEFISVSQQGYETLSQQVKGLFYMVSETLSDDRLVKAGSLYNEFLDTHQKIIKVPPDLTRYERLIPNIAQEYGKEAEFVLNNNGVRADREFWNALHEIFNHSLKNAVIHGLETPDEREAAGKETLGKVMVDIQEDALHLYVRISDDGRGINIQKITEKALESHIVAAEQLHSMTKEEILNLVFVQGVSTADSLDDNAGRGVGMNAVQEAMRQFQGSCRITSELGEGTSWQFSFPKSNVSLPCFIVTVGDLPIAIPENHVEAFQGYQTEYVRQINQKTIYRRNEEVIPLLDSRYFFDSDVHVDETSIRRILIIHADDKKMGIVINDIIHHATLPILPLPEEYRQVPIYLGATLYGSDPVLVLNANYMFMN